VIAVGRKTCTTVRATHFAEHTLAAAVMLMVLVSQSATMTYHRRLLHLQCTKTRVCKVDLQCAGICQWTLWLLVEQARPSLQHLRHRLHWRAMLVFCLHRLMSLKKKAAHDDGYAVDVALRLQLSYYIVLCMDWLKLGHVMCKIISCRTNHTPNGREFFTEENHWCLTFTYQT